MLWKPCKGWQCPEYHINIHTLFRPVCFCRFELASSQSITTPVLVLGNTPSTGGKTCFLLFDKRQASFPVHVETTKICFFMHRNSKLYRSLCYKTWLNCTNIQLHGHYITFNSLQKQQCWLKKCGGLLQDFGNGPDSQLYTFNQHLMSMLTVEFRPIGCVTHYWQNGFINFLKAHNLRVRWNNKNYE